VRGGRLNRETLAAIERWVAREGIECLYFLADPGDPETAPLAEESGFRLVDLRMTLERRLGASGGEKAGAVSAAGPPAAAAPARDAARAAACELETAAGPRVRVRPATGGDLQRLRRIAAASHRDSRFYRDPHFDRRRCDALYAGWIETSCADPAGVVLVAAAADPAGPPAGYVSGTIGEDGEGRIGLFAVAADARGRGVGGALIAAVLDWFAARGADPVTVVTQGRNVRAQRLYQRFGMRTRSVELWFHRWWPPR
jgi:dTDP-4-amino-4,6-dideoxy-D-galactose acyltransferase